VTLTCGVVVVELRGFEPLTPCMPSRDPRHSAHHEPSRSRALPQGSRAGAWWFVRLRRAELLRACCAKRTFICASIEASLEIVTSRCGPSGGAVRVGSGAQEANDPGWRCATLGDLPAAADHGRRQRCPVVAYTERLARLRPHAMNGAPGEPSSSPGRFTVYLAELAVALLALHLTRVSRSCRLRPN